MLLKWHDGILNYSQSNTLSFLMAFWPAKLAAFEPLQLKAAIEAGLQPPASVDISQHLVAIENAAQHLPATHMTPAYSRKESNIGL